MPARRLQMLAMGPAMRRLQEAVCEELSHLTPPQRYTPIKIKEQFHVDLKRIISFALNILQIMKNMIKDDSPGELLNIELFEAWMKRMDVFTSHQGRRSLQHAHWCQSNHCFVYECQFRTLNDKLSVTIYPGWLDVVYCHIVKSLVRKVFYLEKPKW